MAKLYFKYGAMGSSKTAQALITKFNYEERGMKVWLIKPDLDDRDGAVILRSRIGLEAECTTISPKDDIYEMFLRDENRRPEGYNLSLWASIFIPPSRKESPCIHFPAEDQAVREAVCWAWRFS